MKLPYYLCILQAPQLKKKTQYTVYNCCFINMYNQCTRWEETNAVSQLICPAENLKQLIVRGKSAEIMKTQIKSLGSKQ